MSCINALRVFMQINGWNDEVAIDFENKFARVSSHFLIRGQSFRVYIEADDAAELIQVFIYMPMNVRPERIVEVARLLNRVNSRLRIGRFCCHDDGQFHPIQFFGSTLTSNQEATPRLVEKLVEVAIDAVDYYFDLLAKFTINEEDPESAWERLLASETRTECGTQRVH